MDKRRQPNRRRRRVSRNGRRARDPHPESIAIETRQEVARLKAIVQKLVDAVQALTASRRKP